MAEENKDLNSSQSVAGSGLNKDQSATGQDLSASGQGDEPGKLADGTDENKPVPFAEMKKAIDGRKTAEEAQKVAEANAQTLADQMRIMQANQQPAQQPQQPASVYEQAKADLGLAGAEYITEAERGQIYARINEITQLQNQQSAVVFANQQFESSHPDFGNVVGLRNPVNGQIQPTAEILKILTEKPYLAATAYASSQGAYEIVMNERKFNELQQKNVINEEHLKQQGIDISLAPVSGAAAAGGAVTTTGAAITVEQQRENERRVADGELQKG